jgi:hypothetical protein
VREGPYCGLSWKHWNSFLYLVRYACTCSSRSDSRCLVLTYSEWHMVVCTLHALCVACVDQARLGNCGLSTLLLLHLAVGCGAATSECDNQPVFAASTAHPFSGLQSCQPCCPVVLNQAQPLAAGPMGCTNCCTQASSDPGRTCWLTAEHALPGTKLRMDMWRQLLCGY